ncbi:MAG: hypothetical protein Ct9H300mP25_02570 [Acidobacteriota bacterium]|nr:MAG: hypothetical protein Ct9H300mP25_02570 [Acidobacteriota bacterium]
MSSQPEGDIFVADGHSGQFGAEPPEKTGRILKFDKNGTFIKEWGKIGEGPGEFRTHMPSQWTGRVALCRRPWQSRIQIFDQDGNYLDAYYQFSRISGLFITPDDMLYAIDSESSPDRHPDWQTGIRIGAPRKTESPPLFLRIKPVNPWSRW